MDWLEYVCTDPLSPTVAASIWLVNGFLATYAELPFIVALSMMAVGFASYWSISTLQESRK